MNKQLLGICAALPPQTRRSSRERREKKLAGAAKTSFTKKCVADAQAAAK